MSKKSRIEALEHSVVTHVSLTKSLQDIDRHIDALTRFAGLIYETLEENSEGDDPRGTGAKLAAILKELQHP